MSRTLVTIGLLIWSCAFAGAQEGRASNHAAEAMSELALTTSLEAFEDKSGKQTIESIQSQTFHAIEQAVPNFGFTRSVYWIKLSPSNPAPQPRSTYLRIANQWIDFIDIYVRSDPGAQFAHFRAGACVPWSERVPGRGGPALELRFAPEETKTIFIRVQSGTPIRVPLFLLSRAAYQHSQLETLFVLGIFSGVLGFLIIYNLLAWSILKQSAYLYYILLLVGICVHQLAWDDIVPHVSLFGRPEAVLHLFASALSLVCMFNALFVASFMDARRKFPVCYRIFDLLLIGAVALAFLYLFNWYLGNYAAFIYVQFWAWSFAIALGWMWYKGESHARYLFLAHVQFPVVAAATVGFSLGILPFSPIVAQMTKIGYILQGIFFSLALADRFAAMQKNFQNLLEGTVAERSAELVSANQDLQREIGERKRTEQALIKAKETAEAATRAKGEFLANMSHEIRTPINAVLGMIDLMMDSELKRNQRKRAEIIRSAADSLVNLINDILDFSRIEAGKLDLAETHFSLSSVLSGTEALLAVRANDKMLRLSCSISDGVPDRLWGDPNRLRQILLNLGNNAVKFTEQGEITIRVSASEPGNDEVVLHFEVEDMGIGIPREELEKVFDRFSQVDSSLSKKYGGAGLGLAISSQLARAMGGNMWVESQLGKGSTFHFTVRLKQGPGCEEADPMSTQQMMAVLDLRGMRVLLAEDNAFNQAVALEILKKQGCQVTVACNGREAVEAFSSQPFDLILMDLQMPEMDGFEATRIIREKETSGRIPIIAQTAHAFAEYRERCLEVGMDEHVSKPIMVPELLKVLARFASSHTRGTSPRRHGARQEEQLHSSGSATATSDLESLLERLGGDRQALKEMVELFARHLPVLVGNVRSAVQVRDWELVARESHTLKGACTTFGASGLAEVAAEMERNAGSNPSTELEELMVRMDLEFGHLMQYIRKLRL